jgi:ubiquinone/menaquinone biosynthesis C-methylase UbiE
MTGKDEYYNHIASGYDELHGEEQIIKLELIGKELNSNPKLKDFLKTNQALLDVGCGSGISTGFFKAKAKFGVDPSSELIKIAKKNYPTAEFKVAGAESIPYRDKSFDTVISLTAIQNFNDLSKGLEEIKRVGKKDAHYILTFLKKSPKHKDIDATIRMKFDVIKQIEETKDIIYFCKN